MKLSIERIKLQTKKGRRKESNNIEKSSKYYLKEITKAINMTSKLGKSRMVWSIYGMINKQKMTNVDRNLIKNHFEALGFNVDFSADHKDAFIDWE